MIKRVLGCVAAVATLLLPQSAGAQEFLRDRRYQEGIGIEAGDFEIHPGVAAEIGYDSNYFLRTYNSGPNIENGAPAYPPIAAAILRISPSITVSTLGAQRKGERAGEPPTVAFRGGVSGTYRALFGGDDVSSQNNISIQADARADILPGRPWGVAFYGTYVRAINPTVIGNPDLSFDRDSIAVGGEVVWTPGGGTLDWRLGYRFGTTLFEQTQGQTFNNTLQDLYTRGRWRFRPRTALVYDAALGFFVYTRRVNTPALQDSTPVRARIGLNGLITSRLSALGTVGYGGSFFNTTDAPNAQQYDSVIVQAEARFFPTPPPESADPNEVSLMLSSIALGYTRDFVPSYVGSFYGVDRGYGKIIYYFAGRALLSLEGGVSAIEYPNIYFPSGLLRHSASTDVRYDATFFGEYRFANTWGVNATLRYTENVSNILLPDVPTPNSPVFDFSWRRFEAYAGVRWFM